ncbi:hypothetical protein MLD38_000304 [Melastoma candidum]|uniref:Uncharacterized protein n=1 Tax=Melastoma candidum TaxID=119954 RepID=A0ACB9SEK3_9MYRT|nr:hypothetical protein MLD38_000304 [Melastoma candidum]
MWEPGIYYILSSVAVGVSVAITVVAVVFVLKRRRSQSLCKPRSLARDPELQQLGLSVRTTSDKKVSFEGSQCPLTSSHAPDATPRKPIVQMFTIEELRKATEDFGQSNHVEGSVYHGRLGGNDLAVKQIQLENFSKMDFGLFHDATHKHPNIIRLLGTCLLSDECSSSYLVFEYAKNGSLRDWLHGGLAIKSQFIASCYCFLTWNQRLRICLDVAMALQYIHHIMNPSYIHRNIRSRNIFLDEEFNAKVGNFGMASCIREDEVARDKGYLSPEYIAKGSISPGLDIFAYGVVLLEILSGRPPKSQPESDASEDDGVDKIKGIPRPDDTAELRGWMDSALGDDYSPDTAAAIINLATSCTAEDPSTRPTAGDIVERLLRLVEDVPGDHAAMTESLSKPLVKSAATNQA